VYLFGPFTKPNHVRGLFDEPLSDKLYIYINIYIYIYIYTIIIVICIILIPWVDRALVFVPVPALQRTGRCDCLPLAYTDNRCCHLLKSV
jgi:hypothetical protein